MDYSTNSIKKIKSHKYLSCNLFDKIERKPLVIISFKNLKQINSQNLENHTEMISIGSFVEKRIEKIEYMAIISIEFCSIGFVLLERFNPLRMICKTGHFL